jgi:hypothetical protein
LKSLSKQLISSFKEKAKCSCIGTGNELHLTWTVAVFPSFSEAVCLFLFPDGNFLHKAKKEKTLEAWSNISLKRCVLHS